MITVFSTDSCAPCLSLKRYLDSKGAKYRTLNADLPRNAEQLVKLTGRKIVPTTVIGERVITGLNYRALADGLSEL